METDDEINSSEVTTLLLAKIVAMLILGFGSLGIGTLPLFVNRCRLKNGTSNTSQGLLTSLLLCFGGGVLLFTTFIHLVPEVRLSVEKLQEDGQLMSFGSLGLAELLFCGGFFFVYFVEETVHAVLDRKPVASEAVLHRSVSLRRCSRNRRKNSNVLSEKNSSLDTKMCRIGMNGNCDNLLGQNKHLGSSSYFSTQNPSLENANFVASTNFENPAFLSQETSVASARVSHISGNIPNLTCSVRSCNTAHRNFEVSSPHFGFPPANAQVLPHNNAKNTFGNSTSLVQNPNYLTQNLQIARSLNDRSETKKHEENVSPVDENVDDRIEKGNGHSHVGPETSPNASVRGLLTVIALSFHAVFEGLAVGLEPSVASVMYLAGAIATHKLVIAFCVGMELVVAGANTKTICGYLAVFSVVTPLGIGIGVALGHYENGNDGLGPVPALLQGMAAGTLLYVVFFEVLARERANEKSGLLQLAAIVIGFLLMLGLQLATSHSHSHSHTH